MDVTKYY